MDLRLTGLASGFDWKTMVEQLVEVERAPQRRLRSEQDALAQRNNAYGSLLTQLTVLQHKVDALKAPALFTARQASASDTAVATASAESGALLGSYKFNITQLATASVHQGAANVGRVLIPRADGLEPTADVSGLVLSEAGFATAVTAGTFTVNGKQISIATSDTLEAVLERISAATGNEVTAQYDLDSDRITLSSNRAIVLGSATDTSNFLRAARLDNNGTGSVTSSTELGAVRLTSTLVSANFATAVSNGEGGSGQFKINGVAITFDAATDTVADVLARINNSDAGVMASYDATRDRFLLTNKTTGDLGVALEDVSGNFLAATGLLGGGLSRGRDLIYTVNGGDLLRSQSNLIEGTTSGVTGLTVAVRTEGQLTVDITADTARVKSAIKDFLDTYNATQSMIEEETLISPDGDGGVTTGVLAGEREAEQLATKLRSLANAVLSGLSGSLRQLDHLGIQSNGTTNALELEDEGRLDAALAENLADVEALFTQETDGLAVKLSDFLDSAVGDDGFLVAHRQRIEKQIADIDPQVADLERLVKANQERLMESFVAMEKAQANINQQLQFLSRTFGGSTAR
jgi:flagellar hook-associated protein 2